MSDALDGLTVWIIRRTTKTTDAWFTFQHPTLADVIRQRVPSLASTQTVFVDHETLLAAHILPGAATPYNVQSEIEAWANDGGGTEGLHLEVTVRSTRVLWRDGRCVIVAPADQAEEGLAAAALFTFVIRELHHHEAMLEASWTALSSDVNLTHDVRAVDLGRQRHVNAMTVRFQAARIWIARVETGLQRQPKALGPTGRRLFLELVLQADLTNRIRLIDDAVEVGEDLYERANDRLIEKRNFIAEFCVEAAILIAILAELAVLLLEYLRA